MAIIKIVEAPNGATGQYTSFHKAEVFASNQTVVITTNIYATAEAKAEGLNILWQERTVIPFLAFTQDPRNPFYTMLDTYSYSPFKDGGSDEQNPSTDMTLALTPEAVVDVDFGAVIPNYNEGGNIPTQTFESWTKMTLVADGVDEAAIGNLPNPTTFTFLKVPAGVQKPTPMVETTGTFGFATTVPGTYTIQADSFGYLSSYTTFTATAPEA